MGIERVVEILNLGPISWRPAVLLIGGAWLLAAVGWVAWHLLAGRGMAGCGWVTSAGVLAGEEWTETALWEEWNPGIFR